MKTRVFALAAIAAVVAMSCSKIGTENDYAQDRVVKATIEASIDEVSTRATINQETADGPFKVSWASGDQLVVLQKRSPNTYHEAAMNVFEFNGYSFEGTIINPFAGSKWNAFFPASQYSGFSSNSNDVDAVLPHEQDGTQEAFNQCYFMYKLNNSAVAEYPSASVVEGEPVPLDNVGLSFTMKGFSSVIKLNIPDVLNLKTISLSAKDADDADVPLAGKVTFMTAKGDNGLINGRNGTNKGNKTTITIERSQGNLSGDVFIFLLPDTYGGNPVKYYSTAKTLNFTFVDQAGQRCTMPIELDPEYPLTAGTVHDFGSLPTTLPYEFDFKLGIDIENSYKLIAIEGPENMTLSPSTVYPEDGRFAEVTVSCEGFASKKVGVYFKVWEFGAESEFVKIANENGLTNEAATASGEFVSSGLTCNYYTGATIASKNSYNDLQFNSASGTRTCLSFNPTYSANASLGFTIASNTNKARKFYLTYGDNATQEFASNATTEPVSMTVNMESVNPQKTIRMEPAYNGLRIKKIVWMEWGENVTAQTAAVNAEKVAGVLNFDI